MIIVFDWDGKRMLHDTVIGDSVDNYLAINPFTQAVGHLTIWR